MRDCLPTSEARIQRLVPKADSGPTMHDTTESTRKSSLTASSGRFQNWPAQAVQAAARPREFSRATAEETSAHGRAVVTLTIPPEKQNARMPGKTATPV